MTRAAPQSDLAGAEEPDYPRRGGPHAAMRPMLSALGLCWRSTMIPAYRTGRDRTYFALGQIRESTAPDPPTGGAGRSGRCLVSGRRNERVTASDIHALMPRRDARPPGATWRLPLARG